MNLVLLQSRTLVIDAYLVKQSSGNTDNPENKAEPCFTLISTAEDVNSAFCSSTAHI